MMARIEMYYKMDFLKPVQDELFSNIQFWFGNLSNFAEIFLQYEIFLTCSKSF